jgi:hypothetical protein
VKTRQTRKEVNCECVAYFLPLTRSNKAILVTKKMSPPRPTSTLTSAFIVLGPQVQPILNFHSEGQAALFHQRSQAYDTHLRHAHRDWVYFPLFSRLEGSYYTVAAHYFTFAILILGTMRRLVISRFWKKKFWTSHISVLV